MAMKTEQEVNDMYNFIGFFNDGSFMDEKYRKGVMDALTFVMYGNYHDSVLEKSRKIFKEN